MASPYNPLAISFMLIAIALTGCADPPLDGSNAPPPPGYEEQCYVDLYMRVVSKKVKVNYTQLPENVQNAAIEEKFHKVIANSRGQVTSLPQSNAVWVPFVLHFHNETQTKPPIGMNVVLGFNGSAIQVDVVWSCTTPPVNSRDQHDNHVDSVPYHAECIFYAMFVPQDGRQYSPHVTVNWNELPEAATNVDMESNATLALETGRLQQAKVSETNNSNWLPLIHQLRNLASTEDPSYLRALIQFDADFVGFEATIRCPG